MNTAGLKIASSMLITLICFLISGIIFLGPVFLNPHTTGFTFLIFGVSSVILIYVLEYRPLKEFFLSAALIAFLSLITFFKTANITVLLRNLTWFVMITVIVYYTTAILRRQFFRNTKFVSITIWMISFFLLYFVMTVLNTFVFGLYPVREFFHFIKLEMYLGFTMGLGIGIGCELTKLYAGRIVSLIKI